MLHQYPHDLDSCCCADCCAERGRIDTVIEKQSKDGRFTNESVDCLEIGDIVKPLNAHPDEGPNLIGVITYVMGGQSVINTYSVELNNGCKAMGLERKNLFFLMRPTHERWDDKPLPEDEEIDAVHPLETGEFKLHYEARRLVSARHSKGSLIDLVNWLLYRIKKAEKK